MAEVSLLAVCAFPTTPGALWHFSAFCGGVLLILLGLVAWRGRLTLRPGALLLMGAILLSCIWSFVLAVTTSRNVLICAGVPGASAELIRQAAASAQTMQAATLAVAVTGMLTVLLVLLSVLYLFFTANQSSL